MSLLFALALFISPSQAGVVIPVESGVAPAGSASPIVPVSGSVGQALPGSSLGALFDLRGAFPLLPSPVPGLVGPALNFVGENQAAAVAPSQNPAKPVSPAPARAHDARTADRSSILPAKPVPGSSTRAIARDRDVALSIPDNAASRPLVETSAIGRAHPETAAGAGRRFFDQGRDSGRGALEGPSSGRHSDANVALGRDGALLEPVGGADAATGFVRDAEGVVRRGTRGVVLDRSSSLEGEILHDAVGAPPSPGASRGAASFFRSASPNGERIASGPGAGAAVLLQPAPPRPLALDLSRSGLIVRVRAALGSVLPSASTPELHSRLPTASTALLERGAMLEAFSAAHAYSGFDVGDGFAGARVKNTATASAPPVPSKKTAPSSTLWWALLVLPLLAAVLRRVL